MNANALAVTGTPTLVTGALTADTDQALTFNGTTNSASATDSASLSITGSLSLELFVKLSAYPGSTQAILTKSGSYSVSVTSTGFVQFQIVGPSVTTTLLSNVALATGVYNHIACVYNANYSGAQRFGKSTNGAIQVGIDDGDGNNTAVTSTTLLEQGLLRSVTMLLQYFDEIRPVSMSADVYADDGTGVPGVLVTKSDALTLSPPLPVWRSPTPVTFQIAPVIVPAGTYYLGYTADTLEDPGPKSVLQIGADATGGSTSYRASDTPGSPANPFGAATTTTTNVLAAYCDYTATSRSGLEGKALIYLNGALNVSTARTDTISDTANALQICPSLAATVDEVSVWNKPLSSVQIAQHYTAH